MSRSPKFRTAGETATLLGVSSKALRVYERHGLIAPGRNAAGYRVYGHEQIQRLHQVLALKSLGLSLAQISECLSGLGDDLKPILKAQETELRRRIKALEAAASAVTMAWTRLEAGENLSVDDLVTLTKEIVMSDVKPDWRDTLASLFKEHFSEADRQELLKVPRDAADTHAEAAERQVLLAEAKALLGKDPGAPEALDLARRWRERAEKFTGSDKAKLLKLRAVLDEALADANISRTLPWRDELLFIKQATEKLEAEER